MLRVMDLRVRLGGLEVLHGVSLEAPKGSITVVVGPSGSGKTTLLRAIAGLVDYEGSIEVDGVRVDSLPPWERGVAMVQQVPGLLPHLSILDNVAIAAEARRGLPPGEARRLAASLLDEMGLAGLEKRKPTELSGGQLQRAAIAAALATGAKLLLLDEPLSHLDRLTAERLRLLLARLPEKGATLLHVTHDLDEALSLASHMAVLHAGRIEAAGPAGHVYRCPGSRAAAELLGHGILRGEVLGLEPGSVYSLAPDYVVLEPAPDGEWLIQEVVRERGRVRVAAIHRDTEDVVYSLQPVHGVDLRPGERARLRLVAEPCRLLD